MIDMGENKIKVAILDLYEGTENQGMRCLREILHQFEKDANLSMLIDEFEVRCSNHLPGTNYDIYISSGGPGSPVDSKNSEWEINYFNWLQSILDYNNKSEHQKKKYVFFICHSFQLACRFFDIATVTKRNSTAFGVFPIHLLNNTEQDSLFSGLPDPFYAVDSRDYQVIQPNLNRINELGISILAIEKARPHVAYERALMAVRFNEYMIGTQFHPEADVTGMLLHLQTGEKKYTVINNHGEQKWMSMIEQLNDPDKIKHTYIHILPNFLSDAVNKWSRAFIHNV